MNKHEIRSILKDLTEQKAPTSQIDLWPAIQSRVQMSQPKKSKGTIMKTHTSQQILKPAFILLVVLLIAALFFVLPQGRALAQQIFHFFNRGENNIMPGVTVTPLKWVEQTPGVPAATLTPQPAPIGAAFEATCGPYSAPHCTVESIRKMVSYPVFAFPKLPEGMYFVGATGGPDQVGLFYDTPGQTGNLVLMEKPFSGTGNQLSMEVGADANIQSVQIGSIQAEYVKGSYDGNNDPPVWNSNLDLQQLRWVNQGVLFTLFNSGTKPRLDRDELVALAGRLTDGPIGADGLTIAATATPLPADMVFDPKTLYPLTLEQVKEKAGFMPQAPSFLPETLTFTGANYDEKTKVAWLYYKYNQPNDPETTDALVIRQQLAPGGVDCDLCGFILGDGLQVEQYPIGKLVSKNAAIETVKINGFTGQYLEGIGWTSRDDTTGWQWDSTPYIKRLRFRTNELAIDVTSYTFELGKADVLAIAGNLK
jgi:hypothetical protein